MQVGWTVQIPEGARDVSSATFPHDAVIQSPVRIKGDRSLLHKYINRNMVALYNAGLVQLNSSDCTGATTTVSNIVKQMTIPLIQGTIKYVYKSDPAGGASGTASSDEKAMAEGWAFAAALLPMLNDASSSAATTLYNNINMGLGTSGAVPDGFAAVTTAIESTYKCLGITCSQVGALVSSSGSLLDPATAAATRRAAAAPGSAGARTRTRGRTSRTRRSTARRSSATPRSAACCSPRAPSRTPPGTSARRR